MHRQHPIGVSSLTRYIGEAMDGSPIHHAFIMVEKSFDIHAILFYLASIAYKNKREDNLNLEEPIVTQPPTGLISLLVRPSVWNTKKRRFLT
jgi:hypothetical protein